MQNPVPTQDSTSESPNSSVIDDFGATIYKSAISGFLEIPTPPKPSKLPEQTVSSQVLTSVENLQRIKEKEREALEKARLKEEWARKREEKKKAKPGKGEQYTYINMCMYTYTHTHTHSKYSYSSHVFL